MRGGGRGDVRAQATEFAVAPRRSWKRGHGLGGPQRDCGAFHGAGVRLCIDVFTECGSSVALVVCAECSGGCFHMGVTCWAGRRVRFLGAWEGGCGTLALAPTSL